MESEFPKLRALLREQLTAVHQQFVHIIALREWGDAEFAASISAVDNVDFPVAMKVMDYLVAAGVPLGLSYRPFAPGSTRQEIVAAERAVERRMSATLDFEVGADHPAAAWIAAARAPRRRYADWLDKRESEQVREAPFEPTDSNAVGGMFAHLIALIEQTMAHAFIHWHRGERRDADSAWAASGAAMMKATALVRATAARRAIPIPDADVPIRIQIVPASAPEADGELALSCAQAAEKAAESTDGDIAALCEDVAAYARRLADHRCEGKPGAVNGSSTAFRSFEKTLTKYVW